MRPASSQWLDNLSFLPFYIIVINLSPLQSTGAFLAVSRLASATPPPAFVLSRGIGWQVTLDARLLTAYRVQMVGVCALMIVHISGLQSEFWCPLLQGVGILLDGLFGTVTGSTVSVYIF